MINVSPKPTIAAIVSPLIYELVTLSLSGVIERTACKITIT